MPPHPFALTNQPNPAVPFRPIAASANQTKAGPDARQRPGLPSVEAYTLPESCFCIESVDFESIYPSLVSHDGGDRLSRRVNRSARPATLDPCLSFSASGILPNA